MFEQKKFCLDCAQQNPLNVNRVIRSHHRGSSIIWKVLGLPLNVTSNILIQSQVSSKGAVE